jgi:hypothetical protein
MKIKINLTVSYEYKVDKFAFADNATNKDIIDTELNFFRNTPEEVIFLAEADGIKPIITIEQTEE